MALKISTLDFSEDFKKRLLREEENFALEGSRLHFNEKNKKGFTVFEIYFSDKIDERSLKEKMASLVAELVIENLEEELLVKIINSYSEFNYREKEVIKSLSVKHLNPEKDEQFTKIIRKREIISQILGYFEDNEVLNIEGFVRFRLQSYLNDLRFAVQKAVDDFNIEKEYNEFIDLLRYFVELQEPHFGKVNVLKSKEENDSFVLLDSDLEKIEDEHLDKCLQELTEDREEIHFEDLLISALVNISPAEIILHFEDSQVTETLRSIFQDKVRVCPGCDLCHLYCTEK